MPLPPMPVRIHTLAGLTITIGNEETKRVVISVYDGRYRFLYTPLTKEEIDALTLALMSEQRIVERSQKTAKESNHAKLRLSRSTAHTQKRPTESEKAKTRKA